MPLSGDRRYFPQIPARRSSLLFHAPRNMPSYGLLHPPAPADAPADHRAPPAQVKTCTSCNCALGGDPSSILAAASGVDAPVCGRCREHARDTRTQQTQPLQPQDCRQLHHVVPDSPVFPPSQAVAIVQPKAEYEQDIYDATSSPDCDRQPFRVGFPASGSLAQDDRHDGAQASRHHQKFAQLRIKPPTPSPTHASLSPESSFASPRSPLGAPALSDPLVDITYLRVRPQAHHCLYPGATFTGTQKSGRNSYDVNVTIMVRGNCARAKPPIDVALRCRTLTLTPRSSVVTSASAASLTTGPS